MGRQAASAAPAVPLGAAMARTTEDWEVCQPDRSTPPPVSVVRVTRSVEVGGGGRDKRRGWGGAQGARRVCAPPFLLDLFT